MHDFQFIRIFVSLTIGFIALQCIAKLDAMPAYVYSKYVYELSLLSFECIYLGPFRFQGKFVLM